MKKEKYIIKFADGTYLKKGMPRSYHTGLAITGKVYELSEARIFDDYSKAESVRADLISVVFSEKCEIIELRDRLKSSNKRYMSKVKNFNDLIFTPHPVAELSTSREKRYTEAKQAKMFFENGYGISVLCGSIFYSNGIDTYEVAVLRDGVVCFDTYITNDVIPNISAAKVSMIMKQIQELPDINKLISYQ